MNPHQNHIFSLHQSKCFPHSPIIFPSTPGPFSPTQPLPGGCVQEKICGKYMGNAMKHLNYPRRWSSRKPSDYKMDDCPLPRLITRGYPLLLFMYVHVSGCPVSLTLFTLCLFSRLGTNHPLTPTSRPRSWIWMSSILLVLAWIVMFTLFASFALPEFSAWLHEAVDFKVAPHPR